MKGKSGHPSSSATAGASHKHNRSETMSKHVSQQHHMALQQQLGAEAHGSRGKQQKQSVQMNSKLRQHSNNNSVSIRKPLNGDVDLSLEGLPPPNIMNNSIDYLNNNIVGQPQIVKIANEISRS